MNGISLFSGIGGLDLAINKILPTSRTLLYCEGEIYCTKVLQNLFKKGLLHEGIIYSDVKSLPSILHQIPSKINYISGGFPCQPFSTASAGQRSGIKDYRWLWPEILQIIRILRPGYLFLENVSNIINDGAFHIILETLTNFGFNIQWSTLSASDIGANHKRNRIFIFAYQPTSNKLKILNPLRQRFYQPHSSQISNEKKVLHGSSDATLSNTNFKRFKKSLSLTKKNHSYFKSDIFNQSHWFGEPPFSPLCRMDDGITHGMDRLRALGNAVVPLQGSIAFYHLIKRSGHYIEVKL